MNNVGMYQNYQELFQGVNQAGRQNGERKAEGKRSSASLDKPWAVYERTTTSEDIKNAKMASARQGGYNRTKVKEEKTDREELENFTIGKNVKEVKLSDKAQKLLEQLKEKYNNMDFFVANFSTDEEAQRYLSQGTKEYSVVIDPETLEQMAEDEEVFKKYDEILANAGNTFEQVKEQLGEDADKVASLGISIDGDGKVNLFAELDKESVKRVEAQKKMREEKASQKKEQEAAEAKKAKAEKEKETIEERKQEREEQLEKWTISGNAQRNEAGKGWHPQEDRLTFRITGTTIDELVSNIKTATWEE